jgi:hypothetical protein
MQNSNKTQKVCLRERGSAVLEMAAVLPLAALLLSAVLGLGPIVHIGIAVQEAAYDCAVAGAQSLDAQEGYLEGILAARESFSSFRLDPGLANYALSGVWERGGEVVCTVGYRVPLEAMPLRMLLPLPPLVSRTVRLPVQTYKSIWR